VILMHPADIERLGAGLRAGAAGAKRACAGHAGALLRQIKAGNALMYYPGEWLYPTSPIPVACERAW